MNTITAAQIQAKINKGWKPNMYLTNMSIAHFQNSADYVASRVFPIVPVPTNAAHYYTFSKADLNRDNVARKPQFGKVQPALMSISDDMYSCKVDQVIVGIDQISALNFQRTNAPGMIDPRKAKVRFAVEQMKIHLDRIWAKSFFRADVWKEVYQGVPATPSGNQFYQWDDGNSDPISFFSQLRIKMRLMGLRYPNVLCLGVNAFAGLTNNAIILERIKYTGSTANPAAVTENVLAQLFQIDEVVVIGSTYNSGEIGEESFEFICDPDDALLLYKTSSPAIDEPSAGYIFAWDMLGNGQYMAMNQFEGEPGTHTEFVEGLMGYDMKAVSDELGIYLKDCVSN